MNQPLPHASSLFRGRHFGRTVIILCVRWYITSKLSCRVFVEMMAERGVDVPHPTTLRWAQRYVPEFKMRWGRYARPVGTSWRADETFIRVSGRLTYLYRAVDKQGLTIDFLLSEHRGIAAAMRSLTGAIERHGTPERIALDGYPARHSAVAEHKQGGMLRPQSKAWTSGYLNNMVEQDHRRVRQRIYPMLGFKQFGNAAVMIGGIELVQKVRGQFDTSQARIIESLLGVAA